MFCERKTHQIFSYDQQPVSDIAYVVKDSLIRAFPMSKSLWVTLHILWKADSSDIFLWPTGSEWHCTFFETWKPVSSHPFLWPTACEWHCTFCERQCHHIFFLWQTACESHCKFSDLHSQHISLNVWYIITSYLHYIRKWACFHIFSMSCFDIIIIIACKIWFQLPPHVIIPLTYVTFLHFQVSDDGWWCVEFHISLHASV